MQMPTQGRVDPLVSGVRERWDGQGLTGDPWPFMAICSVSRLHQILGKALDTELKKLHLSRTAYFLLTTLALITGGRARLSTLGRIVLLHPTTVKLTVVELERAGLVKRTPHPKDRRATLVGITESGMERVRAANEALEAATEGPLAALAGEYEDLFEALQPTRLAVGDVEL